MEFDEKTGKHFLIVTNKEGKTERVELPVLFELDNKRGTLLSGNKLEFSKGTKMAVGSGDLKKAKTFIL